MKPERIKDSFRVGIISGLLFLLVFYFILSFVRTLIINYYGNPYMMRPPIVQLITLLFNIIIFRVLIINFDKEKTAKGILFITTLIALSYFYFYFRLHKA